MQGPTHALIAIGWQASVDRVLTPRLPDKARWVRWPVIIGGAFFLHGLLDILAKVTYHDNVLTPFNISTLLPYIFVFIWIGKTWIWRKWRNFAFWKKGRWREWKYGGAVLGGWLFIDFEHFYHWIFGNDVKYAYFLHHIANWPWEHIGPLMRFVGALPNWHENEAAFLIELGAVFIAGFTFFLLSRSSPREYIGRLFRDD